MSPCTHGWIYAILDVWTINDADADDCSRKSCSRDVIAVQHRRVRNLPLSVMTDKIHKETQGLR